MVAKPASHILPAHSNAGLMALNDRLARRQAEIRASGGLGVAAQTLPSPTAELLAAGDGIAIELQDDASAKDRSLQEAIKSKLPQGWELRDDSIPSANFRGLTALPPPDGVPTVDEMWELAAEVAEVRRVVSATPLFAQLAPTPNQTAGLGFAGDDDIQAPHDWHLDTLRIPGAWAVSRGDNIEPGQGVTVAVIDTGYTRHPEIFNDLTKSPGNSQQVHGADLLDGDADPLDPLEGGWFFPTPSHGTSVASVIASGEGPDQPSLPDGQFVTGIAPAAQVFPVRMTTSVVLLLPNKLIEALHTVIDLNNVDVINISLGMPYGWPALQAAVQEAIRLGMVVVAASGNYWPTVVYPAAFPEVLAVAACGPDLSPWLGSSPGAAVDVLAPGRAVQRANSKLNSAGDPVYEVTPGTGTTFGAANCTGLAALWVAKHGGRRQLVKHYKGEAHRVQQAYHFLIRKTAQPLPGGAPEGMYGVGIPDAEELLRADLPSTEELDQDLQDMGLMLAHVEGLTGATNGDRPVSSFRPTDIDSPELIGTTSQILNSGRAGKPVRPPELAFKELRFQLANRPALLSQAQAMISEGRIDALRANIMEIPQLSSTLRAAISSATSVAKKAARQAPEAAAAEAALLADLTIPEPTVRRLQVYAVDPSYSTSIQTAQYNRITVDVPWENVDVGPVGEYLEVVDIDPASGYAYAPVNLNDPRVVARDGLEPSEGDPRFHQQMVYAVAMKTIKHFERALGRPAFWETHPEKDATGRWLTEPFNARLRIYPHALRTQNAYYSSGKRALLMGYFASPGYNSMPGPNVFTCLSYDIIAHEMTHALLDGMYRRYTSPTNPDVLAFHEAFADIVALFQHFTHPELLRAAIEQTRGDLEAESQLGKLAVQFGQATGMRGALRDAIGRIKPDGGWERMQPQPSLLQTESYLASAHKRGSILVAAVFDTFLLLYKERIKPLVRLATNGSGVLPHGNLPVDLVAALAGAASNLAADILERCIRALDYLPPVDVTFGEYLRAIVTADYDLVPDDRNGYRVAFAQAFRAWGIQPAGVTTVAPDSLYWSRPDRSSAASRFELGQAVRDRLSRLLTDWRVTRNRYDLHKGSLDEKRAFHNLLSEHLMYNPTSTLGMEIGIDLSKPFEVHTLRPASSIGPDGETNPLVVVTLTQEKTAKLAKQADGMSTSETFRIGSTILFGLGDGKVRYIIHRRDSQGTQGAAIKEYREFRLASVGAIDPYTLSAHRREPFASLHLTGRY